MVDLNELERLEKAATPAGWKVFEEHDFWRVSNDEKKSWEQIFDDGTASGEYSPSCTIADRDLLVTARNALPALIAELRAARNVVRAVRNHLEAEHCFGPHYGILMANVGAYDAAKGAKR